MNARIPPPLPFAGALLALALAGCSGGASDDDDPGAFGSDSATGGSAEMQTEPGESEPATASMRCRRR